MAYSADELSRELDAALSGTTVSRNPSEVPAPSPQPTGVGSFEAELDAALQQTAPAATPPPDPVELQKSFEYEIVKALDPSLDDTKDKPPMITRGQMFQMEFDRKGPMSLFPFAPTGEAAEAIKEGVVGTARALLAVPKGVGAMAQAIQDVGNTEKFEPWTGASPVSSTLITMGRLADKMEETFLPKVKEGPWYDHLPEAAGSTLAFLAGGQGLVKLAGWSIPRATAFLGGAMGASEQTEDAIREGATPDEAAIAAFGGAAFGMSEAISGTWFLNKLNKATGGQVFEKIKDFNSNRAGSPAWEAFKGMLAESGQEGFQTVGGNLVASDIAGYDPTRRLDENLVGAMATGGLIGSSVAGGIGLMERAERKAVLQKLDEFFKEQQATGDPINSVSGVFTPVSGLVEMNKMKSDIDQVIQSEGAALEGTDFDKRSRDSILAVGLSDQEPRIAPPDINIPLIEEIKNRPALVFDRKALGIKEGEATTIGQALEKTPIVVREPEFLSKLVKEQEDVVKLTESVYASYVKRKDKYTKEQIAEQKKKLDVEREKLTDVRTKKALGIKTLREAKNFSAAFFERLLPEWRLVLASDMEGLGEDYGKAVGIAFGSVNTRLDVTERIAYVGINVDQISSEALYNYKTGTRKDHTNKLITEILIHELGHVLTQARVHSIFRASMRAKMPEKRQEARNTFNYLYNSYRRWMEDAVTKPYSYMIGTKTSPELAYITTDRLAEESGPATEVMPNLMDNNSSYHYSFEEFFADMTARLAVQGKLEDVATTKYFSGILKEYEKVFETLHPGMSVSTHGEAWLNFIQSLSMKKKISDEIEKLSTNRFNVDLIGTLARKIPGFDPKNFAGLLQHKDRWHKGFQYGLNLIQMAKEFSHIPHWGVYLKAMEEWSAYQRNMGVETIDTIVEWRRLGKTAASQLTDVLYEEGLSQKYLTDAELKARLDGESLAVYKKVREQLDRMLEEMRTVALADETKSRTENEEAYQERIKEINEEFDKLKSKGYFPFLRFGKFTITARAQEAMTYQGQKYKRGDLITFPVFESEKERDEAAANLKKEFGGTASVSSSIMNESEFAIQGMPRAVIRSLRNKLELMGTLTPEQKGAMDKAIQDAAPFRNFTKNFLKKKKIRGYSMDAMRSFAYYMRSGAAHVSRVKYADDMRLAITGMQSDVETLKMIGARAQDRQEMKHWMDRHLDYVMNPAEEWAALRGAGFVAYLGFNIKSAAVNLTQILTTVTPYLSAQYGDVKAISALARATKQSKDWWLNRKPYLDEMLIADKTGKVSAKARLGRMIAQGLHEGWLDQSLATELAIASSENTLDRALPIDGTRIWHKVASWSAVPFHVVEKMNRYITAIAAYELDFAKNSDHAKAVTAAKLANYSANYENARWNRPEFMRGKKSVALLFMNYVQNTLYFATRDPGATRYLLMMLILGGVMGEPFAEDIVDLVDFAATGLKRLLGMSNPKVQLRQLAREHLTDLGADPDLILHGLSQNSFGFGQLGELTGIPIPRFDLSGSVGLGNVLPLTEIPGQLLQKKPNDVLASALASAAGASGNLVADYYDALTSSNVDDWKKMEKLLPLMSMRNVSKAIRLAERGKEETAAGDVIASFDPHDPRDFAEILGQGLGFTPERLDQGWEHYIATKDLVEYYKVQQQAVSRRFSEAVFQEDREAIADALKAYHEYNSMVPLPDLKLKGPDLKTSAREYVRSKKTRELGYAAQRKYVRIEKYLDANYPDFLPDGPYGDKKN